MTGVKSAERNDPYALQFQYAKQKMEEALRAQSDVTYSIVRPTAFFKSASAPLEAVALARARSPSPSPSPAPSPAPRSVSGQLEVVDGGAPFVYFDLGEGKSATCNPISEPDLAAALVDTIADPAKVQP